MYLNGTYSQLTPAFAQDTLHMEAGYFVAKGSREKVVSIVESAGFCPFILNDTIPSDVTFTVVPYALPYLNFEEIQELLQGSQFSSQENAEAEDPWESVNNCRSAVSSAFNQVLSTLISRYVQEGRPVVEIGSGTGYALSQEIIRTQPSTTECQLLKNEGCSPVYQVGVERLYDRLSKSAKKVSLFFGLNVFDSMCHHERPACLQQLSKLQNRGDRIIVALDATPHMQNVFAHIKELHPNDTALPYFPLGQRSLKFSVLMVPKRYGYSDLCPHQLYTEIASEFNALDAGYISQKQHMLSLLQARENLKVVVLEDFFVSQIRQELHQVGYETKTYYDAAFTLGAPPDSVSIDNGNLIYKAATDALAVGQCSLSDENLHSWLHQKAILVPERFLQEKEQMLFGAELLVIEATKLYSIF